MKKAQIVTLVISSMMFSGNASAGDCQVVALGKSCHDVGYIVGATKSCPGMKFLLQPDDLLKAQKDHQDGQRTWEVAIMGDGPERAERFVRVCKIARNMDRYNGIQIIGDNGKK